MTYTYSKLLLVQSYLNNIQLYGAIGGYIYYKKYNEEEKLKIFYNIEQEDQKLKNRVMVDY